MSISERFGQNVQGFRLDLGVARIQAEAATLNSWGGGGVHQGQAGNMAQAVLVVCWGAAVKQVEGRVCCNDYTT